MLADPRPTFKECIRRYLGTDLLFQLEAIMTNEILTLLQGLVAQTKDLDAIQQASVVNIHNGFQRMQTAIADLTQRLNAALDNDGAVTPEMQAAAEQIQTALADIRKGAETASGDFDPVDEPPADDNPPVVDPGTPVTDVPVDAPPAQDEPVSDVPTDDSSR